MGHSHGPIVHTFYVLLVVVSSSINSHPCLRGAVAGGNLCGVSCAPFPIRTTQSINHFSHITQIPIIRRTFCQPERDNYHAGRQAGRSWGGMACSVAWMWPEYKSSPAAAPAGVIGCSLLWDILSKCSCFYIEFPLRCSCRWLVGWLVFSIWHWLSVVLLHTAAALLGHVCTSLSRWRPRVASWWPGMNVFLGWMVVVVKYVGGCVQILINTKITWHSAGNLDKYTCTPLPHHGHKTESVWAA